MSKGLFVVIEGTDGSGKGTQHELLCARLRRENIAIETVDFPRYNEPSSYFIQQYLNGNYGDVDSVSAKQTSLFYALDRFAANPQIKVALQQGRAVVANRFTSSNMAFQGAKVSDKEQRQQLFAWLDELEHDILEIPRPNLVIVLSLPAKIAQQNVGKKQARSYTTLKHDIHEANLDFLERTITTYDELCALFPEQYTQINCMQNTTTMKSINEIHDDIWQLVQAKLP
ncbi:MAG TPA: dTMP kinase [Candidatus Saccharimonadales bacterium]|nr:dTMP kinase [Candidatus Saccharimonadales bacterium]